MDTLMKNISKSEIIELKNEVSYLDHQVVSKTLVQNPFVSMTLFAFDQNEEISAHESRGDAFVYCLDGIGEITIDGQKYEIHEGETIVMPAKHPHAVFALEKFKMLLVVIFPVKEEA
jgi:quercetin dioxygenase-like cupin family protein